MKYITNRTAAIAACAALALSAGVARGAITGSAHDFSGKSWNASGEICITCHTPHNSDTTVTAAPLWNHKLTTATFQPYASGTLKATVGQPTGVSKLCLSCHDGSVALDSFGGVTGTVPLPATDPHYLGINLTNDHPVSFVYSTAATADSGLVTAASVSFVDTGSKVPLFGATGTLECASCHDVHNSTGIAKLLVKANGASALCLTCHIK